MKASCIASLLLCALSMCIGMACSQTALINEPEAQHKMICNEQADKALMSEDYETAISLHERILEKDPHNGLETYHLGYIHGQLGNHSEEVSYYEKAIDLGFKEDRIFLNLGMAYGELGQMERAIGAFRQDLVSNPDSAEAHLALAMAYQKGSAGHLAQKECLEAIRLDPKNLDARFLLTMLYLGRDEFEKASEQLRQILAIDPTHEGARRYLEDIERGEP